MNKTTKSKDQKYLGRDAAALPIDVAKSKGDFLFDSNNKKYIDFVTGWCVGNLGWGNVEIKKALKKFDGPEYVSPRYLYKAWADLAELLAQITPPGLVKSFRATGGTEAVEIALQAAMAHTKRHKFISIEGSYHGHSIGAMSIGSSDFRKWYKNLLNHCHKIKPPLGEKALRQIEKLLKQRDIAAYISEPIICNLGVEIPEKDFLPKVQKLCRKYGTLFIMDEVATGFGRTGKMFASEHFNLRPDIICLAKGVSGGYGAIGATIMTKEVAKSFEFDFSFYSTFGWHPLNVEATLANLRYFIKHQKAILNNANKISAYLVQELSKINFKSPVEIRCKGLAIGLRFTDKKYAAQLLKKALAKKLLLSTADSQTITLFPALTISKKTVQEGLNILKQIA